jgi:enoyl-CoA hydratase/carnithine racemase
MEERMISGVLNAIDAPVIFEERTTLDGRRIGVATLNVPKTLNSLSLEMVRLLDAQLGSWASNTDIVLVVLQGAGEKAFCAGGDLHNLYRSMLDYRSSGSRDIRDNAYASHFFAIEYQLDYRIHTYPKPVLCWGHGIVMGGGIGLMAGASHRVVTEHSKLAFPEITIGLYPDVGGSRLLNRVPDRAGLFLALTGAPLNTGDAIYADLADWSLREEQRQDVFEALIDTHWSDDVVTVHAQLGNLLKLHASMPGDGPLQHHCQLVARICAHETLELVAGAIADIEESDPWLDAAKQAMASGAPSSARLAFELQRRAASMSLADVFRLEYLVSLKCAASTDFAEGIRALLVDKDRQPQWCPATLPEASRAWADEFFGALGPGREYSSVSVGHSNDVRR